jgi:hypothetical protein
MQHSICLCLASEGTFAWEGCLAPGSRIPNENAIPRQSFMSLLLLDLNPDIAVHQVGLSLVNRHVCLAAKL